jgi:hypothetical protein
LLTATCKIRPKAVDPVRQHAHRHIGVAAVEIHMLAFPVAMLAEVEV